MRPKPVQFKPLRTAGLYLSPIAMSLILMARDRANGQVAAVTQDVINAGRFWQEAKDMKVPGLGPERIEDGVDWIKNQCPEFNLIRAKNFVGDVAILCPEKTKLSDPVEIDDPCLPDGCLYVLEPRRSASMFEAAYSSPNSLLAEYQHGFGYSWPKQFNWWMHLVEA